MNAIRIHYLDASAIVKLFVEEEGSDTLRKYRNQHSTFFTTSICFSEAIGVLKMKWLRKNISKQQYLNAMNDLMAEFTYGSIGIDEIEIKNREVFHEVEKFVKNYELDVADAFQIYTLRAGFFSNFAGDSKPILITADSGLANAARKEGFRIWNCVNEPAP